MRLLISNNGHPVLDIDSGGRPISIGSGEHCDICLRDERVPRELAILRPNGDHVTWALDPLELHPPVRINGSAIEHATPVHAGDCVTISEYVIQIDPPSDGLEAPAAAASDDAAQRRTGKVSVASMTRFVQFQLPSGTLIKKPEEPIQLTTEQLEQFSRTNLAISQCEAVEPFMDALLTGMHDMFPAARCWIGIRRVNYGPMDYVEGRSASGQSAELSEIGDKLKPRALDRGQALLVPRASETERFSVLIGPLPGPDGPLGMVYLDTGDLAEHFTAAQLDLFVALCKLSAMQLDAIFQDQARQRAALTEGQVSVAHAIQARITPRKLPQWPNLQWGAFREPGREHTGDIYDLVKLSNQCAAVVVAHTTATGALPTLLMAQAQAAFRTACMHLDPPHVYLRMMNHLLYDGQRDHPLDALAAIIDPATGEVRYSVAGYVGAYIINCRGAERRLAPSTATQSLGLDRASVYPPLTDTLAPGETLVLYTPGVTTARNRHEEVFGEQRFLDILCDGFGQLASSMLKEMLSDLQSFTEGGKQPDDITVLLAHRTDDA